MRQISTMSSIDNQLNNFRNRFECLPPSQKTVLMGQLQAYITTQVSDPVIMACPLTNQLYNHFLTPSSSVCADWWNQLFLWKTSPLVGRILGFV